MNEIAMYIGYTLMIAWTLTCLVYVIGVLIESCISAYLKVTHGTERFLAWIKSERRKKLFSNFKE